MAEISQSVGIIGGGSMGGSIARGIVAAGIVPASRVSVADMDKTKLASFAEEGMGTFADAADLLAAGPDVVILAVKPQVLGSVMESIAQAVAGRLVISIAAGVQIKTIQAALPEARVVRVMPNLPAQVRSGGSAIAPSSTATADDVELARTIFSALGAAYVMREDQLDVSGAVAGTAPAFFALFVDTLTKAGVRAGLPADACRDLVEYTMRGTAEQLIESGEHPRAYVEKVTSPGGTTAAALYELEPRLLEGSYAAVDAALERTRELAGD